MSRLTKYKDGKYLVDSLYVHKAIEKLGRYEDIEEEDFYGISLIELVNIQWELQNHQPVFINEGDGWITKILTNEKFCFVSFDDEAFVLIEDGDFKYLYFGNYKSYWSLNKEDLE